MKIFSFSKSEHAWVIPVTLLTLVVGFMVRVVWITEETRSDRLEALPADQRARIASGSIDLQEEYVNLDRQLREARLENARLQEQNTRLQNTMATDDNRTEILNESLQQAKVAAALTEVSGPGIVITLNDSRRSDDLFLTEAIIHDEDLLKTVNELWNAGAEAVSVGNFRVGPRTNFRCVGTTILVDGVKIAPPVVIRAIGDPQVLFSAMNMPGGVLDIIREVDPAMVKIEAVERHQLPAFTASTSNRFAEPVVATP